MYLSGKDASEIEAALGAAIGALVGDAAGARLEFIDRRPTAEEVREALDMQGGGVWGVAPGQYTDDGELTIALLRALSEGGFELDRIAKYYRRWVDSSPFDLGATIGSTIGGAHDAVGMQQAARESCSSKANGSLMRCTPLGVWGRGLRPGDLAEFARLDSGLSHANRCCQDTVACYAIAVAHLVRENGDRTGALEAAASWAQEHAAEEVRGWLDLAGSDTEIPGFPQQGFVKIAFVHAFRLLGQGADFPEALRRVLSIGGDTDTNACIVGGLIGAATGLRGVPDAMQTAVLNCDTSRGRPRPKWLHAKAVPELVRRLVKATTV